MPRISRRAPLFAGAAMALLLAAPVAADTTGGPINTDSASANVGGGQVVLDRDNLTGSVVLTYLFSDVQLVTCADGTDGEVDTYFFGQGTPTSYAFGRNLSSASASGRVTGVLSLSGTCAEFSPSDTDTTYAVSLSLTGSKYLTTQVFKSTSKNLDGTTTTITDKIVTTQASGSATVDGARTAVALADGQIQHHELTTKTK